jgi:hypothetical protein
MGIFSDKCQALIDTETGKCLSGEALSQARREKKWPRCGHRVKKAARRCSACGATPPGGWAKCGGCGEWVGVESEFCWNCGHELHPEDRGALADGRWRKPDGVLAKRFDVGDVKALLSKGSILVEAGSSAILLQNGRFKDLLKPGEHTLDSLGHRINHWGDPPPRSVILVDSGDIIAPIRVEDLRTAEDIPVQLYAETIVRLAPDNKGAQALVENVIKDARELSFDAFAEMLKGEIRYAVRNLCNTSTVEDLFKDPNLRTQVEDELQRVVADSQARYGFQLVRVSSAEFTGKEYELLRQQNGDVEIARRRLEFDQRLRETVSKDKMHAFATEQDLEAYVTQLSHEKEIADEHRDQELAMLKLVHRGELDDRDAAFTMAADMEKTAHEVGIKLKWDDYTRNKLVEDAKTEAEVARVWLQVREEKEKIKLRKQADQMALYEGKDLQTLIAVLPEAKQAALLDLNNQLMTKGMSRDQILALAAKDNPELARVLLEQARAENEDRDKEWDERKRLLDSQAERLERIMTKALETTAEAAKGQGNSTQVIK